MITRSPEETLIYAKKIARALRGGEVFVLTGDLGGGKTTFTRGLVEGLGFPSAVTSPTFVLMQVYSGKKGRIRHVYHFDLYRLKSVDELVNLGFIDFLGEDDAVVLLEWGEKFLPEIRAIIKEEKKKLQQIIFENKGNDKRIIKLK